MNVGTTYEAETWSSLAEKQGRAGPQRNHALVNAQAAFAAKGYEVTGRTTEPVIVAWAPEGNHIEANTIGVHMVNEALNTSVLIDREGSVLGPFPRFDCRHPMWGAPGRSASLVINRDEASTEKLKICLSLNENLTSTSLLATLTRVAPGTFSGAVKSERGGERYITLKLADGKVGSLDVRFRDVGSRDVRAEHYVRTIDYVAPIADTFERR